MTETRHSTTIDIKVDDRDVVRLGEQIDRAFTAKALDAFNKSLERQSQVLSTLIKQQEQLRQTLEKTHQAVGGGSGGGGGRGGGGGGGDAPGQLGFWGTASAVGTGTFGGQALYGLLQRLVDAGGAAMRGSFSDAAMRTLPGGGTLADTVAGAKQYYQTAVAADTARMGAYGATGLRRAAMDHAMGWGTGLGIDPLQMPGMLADFAGQTGMRGSALSSIAPTLATAARFGGVNAAGSIIGAAGQGGGEVSAGRAQALVRGTIGSALDAGVRPQRLDQATQSISSFVEDMRSRGIMLEPESINALVRGFGQVSHNAFRDMVAVRAAQAATQGAIGAMGGTGLATAIMMQVSGVIPKPGGKAVNYAEALENVQNDAPYYAGLAMERVRHIAGSGGDKDTNPAVRALIASQMLEKFGVSQTVTQGRGFLEGKNPFDETDQGGAEERGKKYLGAARRGAPLGALPVEAGRRMQEINLGANKAVQDLSQHVLQLDLTIAKSLLPGMSQMVDTIIHFAEGLGGLGSLPKPSKAEQAKMLAGLSDEELTAAAGMYAGQSTTQAEDDEQAAYAANVRDLGMRPDQAAKAAASAREQRAAAPASTEQARKEASFHLRAAANAIDAMQTFDMVISEAEAAGGR